MRKYELAIRIAQMHHLIEERKYRKALAVIQTFDIRKIRMTSDLMAIADVYMKTEQYDAAKATYMRVYRRSRTRRILYRLIYLSIRTNELEEAESYYEEFVSRNPGKRDALILRYRIDKAKGVSISSQIRTLEELKNTEYMEEWAYELAKLYHRSGRLEDCKEECKDIILWFGSGEIVERAKNLIDFMERKELLPYMDNKDYTMPNDSPNPDDTGSLPELDPEILRNIDARMSSEFVEKISKKLERKEAKKAEKLAEQEMEAAYEEEYEEESEEEAATRQKNESIFEKIGRHFSKNGEDDLNEEDVQNAAGFAGRLSQRLLEREEEMRKQQESEETEMQEEFLQEDQIDGESDPISENAESVDEVSEKIESSVVSAEDSGPIDEKLENEESTVGNEEDTEQVIEQVEPVESEKIEGITEQEEGVNEMKLGVKWKKEKKNEESVQEQENIVVKKVNIDEREYESSQSGTGITKDLAKEIAAIVAAEHNGQLQEKGEAKKEEMESQFVPQPIKEKGQVEHTTMEKAIPVTDELIPKEQAPDLSAGVDLKTLREGLSHVEPAGIREDMRQAAKRLDDEWKKEIMPEARQETYQVKKATMGREDLTQKSPEMVSYSTKPQEDALKEKEEDQNGGLLPEDLPTTKALHKNFSDLLQLIAGEPDPSHFVLMGDNGENILGVAKRIVRVMHENQFLSTTKIAGIKGDQINKMDLLKYKNSLKGCCLLVENAAELLIPTIAKIFQLMDEFEGDFVVILADEGKILDQLFCFAPTLARRFKYIIDVSSYTVDDYKETEQ